MLGKTEIYHVVLACSLRGCILCIGSEVLESISCFIHYFNVGVCFLFIAYAFEALLGICSICRAYAKLKVILSSCLKDPVLCSVLNLLYFLFHYYFIEYSLLLDNFRLYSFISTYLHLPFSFIASY